MKKIILSVLTLSALAISAQVRVNVPAERNFKLTDKISYPKGTPGRSVVNRDNVSEWYQFWNAYGTNVDFSTLDRSLFWLAPDTNGFALGTDGTKSRNYIHYLGSCFDPKDTTFVDVNTILTKFQTYTIDTLEFWQTYQRKLDSVKVGGNMVHVVDTVFVQYFVAPNLQFNTYSSTSEPEAKHIGMPNTASYNPATRLNNAANKMDTLFLTEDWADSTDGTSVFFRRIRIPVTGLTSGSNSSGTTVSGNVSGFGFTFKPMVKPALNDTFSISGNTDENAIFNKRNRYGTFIRLPKNGRYQAKSPYKRNNTFLTNFELATGVTNSLGWKAYYPGDFFGTNGVLLDYQIFISSSNLNTKSAGQVKNVAVYPNPTAAGTTSIINYTLDKSSDVVVNITDLNGRVVKSFNMDSRSAGKQSYEINTSGLTKGMYIVNVIAGSDKVASKLCIQ